MAMSHNDWELINYRILQFDWLKSILTAASRPVPFCGEKVANITTKILVEVPSSSWFASKVSAS